MTNSKKELVEKIIELGASNEKEITRLGGLEFLSEDLLVTILRSQSKIRHDLFPEFLDKYWKDKEEAQNIEDIKNEK
jgi:hypothetical protein